MNLFFKITSLLLLLMSVSIPAQLQKHSFEQLEELQETEKRKMVIFIHTDWCKYCQWMKNTTFKNAQIISILNEKFWFVDLNAEHKTTLFSKVIPLNSIQREEIQVFMNWQKNWLKSMANWLFRPFVF